MTQVGHTFTGIAIGVACLPNKKSTPARLLHLVVFGLLANIPDFPLKNWGHDLYYFSHSLFVNLLLILLVLSALVFLKGFRRKVGGWVIIIGGTLAWLSHLLLDTFYNHGKGLLNVLAAFRSTPGAAHPLVFGGERQVVPVHA